jgi:hypothetical protein
MIDVDGDAAESTEGVQEWKLKEQARNLPARDRPTGLLALYGSILFFRRPIRHLFRAPV